MSAGELGEEVFVDAAQDVLGAVLAVAKADGADKVAEAGDTASALTAAYRSRRRATKRLPKSSCGCEEGRDGVTHVLARGDQATTQSIVDARSAAASGCSPTALLTIKQRTGHGWDGVAVRIHTSFNRKEAPKRPQNAQID